MCYETYGIGSQDGARPDESCFSIGPAYFVNRRTVTAALKAVHAWDCLGANGGQDFILQPAVDAEAIAFEMWERLERVFALPVDVSCQYIYQAFVDEVHSRSLPAAMQSLRKELKQIPYLVSALTLLSTYDLIIFTYIDVGFHLEFLQSHENAIGTRCVDKASTTYSLLDTTPPLCAVGCRGRKVTNNPAFAASVLSSN